MAQKVITQLIDDLSGVAIVDGEGETVRFSFEGTLYEIDLHSDNARQFRNDMAKYIKAGRKVGKPAKPAKVSGPVAADVRAWAVAQGIDVPSKGRVPADIIKKYEERD